MRTRPLYDYLALLARIGIGFVFMAHGWQKVSIGIAETAREFNEMGVPGPTAAAIYTTFVELLGGVALVIGLALPVVGVLLFLDMAAAFALIHAENGVFLVDENLTVENGFELVLVLGLAALLFGFGGGGRFTIDQRLFPRRSERPAGRAKDLAVTAPDPLPEPSADIAETSAGKTSTSKDVLVAGARKRRSGKASAEDTQPIARPGAGSD
ncbi:MAG: DoxX family protein [Actinomadura sp.]